MTGGGSPGEGAGLFDAITVSPPVRRSLKSTVAKQTRLKPAQAQIGVEQIRAEITER